MQEVNKEEEEEEEEDKDDPKEEEEEREGKKTRRGNRKAIEEHGVAEVRAPGCILHIGERKRWTEGKEGEVCIIGIW